jgi:hypothetical protein
MKHICNNCNFETTILSKYLRHVQTDKHKTKIETIKKEEETIKKLESMETNVINNINEVKNDVNNVKNEIKYEAEKNNKKIIKK